MVTDRAKKKNKKTRERKVVVFDRKNPPSQTEGGAPSSTWSFGVATEVREKKRGLLIAEGVDGVEFGGTRSRIEAGGETDKDGDGQSEENEPPGNSREFNGIEILAMEIKVCAKRDRTAEKPAEQHAKNATDSAHHTRFDKEKLLDVRVGSAEGFEDANFTATFEDCHDQRVDDAERGDGQREAAKNADEEIENGEENSQGFRSVEKRKGAKSHFLDGGFKRVDLGRRFRADRERRVGGFVGAGVANNVAKVVDLSGAEG